MAVWGVPVAHEDDAERAVRAGLELVATVSAMGEDVGAAGLAMRVGIVTGEVAVTVGATARAWSPATPSTPPPGCRPPPSPVRCGWTRRPDHSAAAAIASTTSGAHLKGKAEPGPCGAPRRSWPDLGGGATHRRAGGAVHRPRHRAATGQGAVPRHRGVGTPAPGGDRRRAGDGQVPPRLGVREVHRRTQCGDSLASRSLSLLRRRGRVLGACGGRAHAARAHRGRCRRRGHGAVWTPAWSSSSPRRRNGTGFVPAWPSCSARSPSSALAREDLFAAWTTFLERVGGGDPVVFVIDDAQHADDGLLDFLDHLLDTARARNPRARPRPPRAVGPPVVAGRATHDRAFAWTRLTTRR